MCLICNTSWAWSSWPLSALHPPPQVPHIPSHPPLPSYIQRVPRFPDSQGVLHNPHSSSLTLFPVRSQQHCHGAVSLGSDDDHFCPSGHL